MKPPVAASLTTLAQVDALVAYFVDAPESPARGRLGLRPAHPHLLELVDAHREMKLELLVYIPLGIWSEEPAVPAAEVVARHGRGRAGR